MWQETIAVMVADYEGLIAGRSNAAMPKTLQENLTERLSDSVERLQKQVEAVEFWASAVSGLAAPVPDYEPEATKVARYLKPGRPARRRRRRRTGQNRQNESKPSSA